MKGYVLIEGEIITKMHKAGSFKDILFKNHWARKVPKLSDIMHGPRVGGGAQKRELFLHTFMLEKNLLRSFFKHSWSRKY
jgi:hypothetical protein